MSSHGHYGQHAEAPKSMSGTLRKSITAERGSSLGLRNSKPWIVDLLTKVGIPTSLR